MRTFASLIDFSQSALLPNCNFAHINIQFQRLYFGAYTHQGIRISSSYRGNLIQSASKLIRNVVCCRRMWPATFSPLKWRPPVIWMCQKPFSAHSLKYCSLPYSSSKTAHHHNTPSLCVHILNSISHTDGICHAGSTYGRPDHRISHPVILFPCRDIWKTASTELRWPTSKVWRSALKLL